MVDVSLPGVFITWSGQRTLRFGDALRELLIQCSDAFRPWMSSRSIQPGAPWRTEVDEALRSAFAGVILLSPENYRRPWVLYEAGRLDSRVPVFPVLVDLPMELLPTGYPLRNQSVTNTKSDLKKLTTSLADAAPHRPSRELLEQRFDTAWEGLSCQLTEPYQLYGTPHEDQFCVDVFSDISAASLDSICGALSLYAECCRVAVRTHWTNNCPRPVAANTERSHREKIREELVAEIDALRLTVLSAFVGEGILGTSTVRKTIESARNTFSYVHKKLVEHLETNDIGVPIDIGGVIRQHDRLRESVLGGSLPADLDHVVPAEIKRLVDELFYTGAASPTTSKREAKSS